MKWNVFVALLCIVCHEAIAQTDQISQSDRRLVYGTDNRIEPYAISDTNLLTLVQADVAIINSGYLQKSGSTWNIASYGTYNSSGSCGTLCATERFYGQKNLPFCSGFLVSSNQIVTAGHCVNGRTASQMAFLFDFKEQNSETGPLISGISDDNVYIGSYYNHTLTANADWAVVTLDRTVVGRTPLPIRRSGSPSVGDSLILIGHPFGLTMKVAPGATVRSWSSALSRFEANCDSYAGNSGSMIVNAASFEVEGFLVSGQADFVSNGSCCVSNVCPDTGCPGWEYITKISYVAGLIPDGYPVLEQASNTTTTDSGGSDSGDLGGLRGTVRVIVAAVVVAVGFAAIAGIVACVVIRRRRRKATLYPAYEYDDNGPATLPTVQAGSGPVPVMSLSDIQSTMMKTIDPEAPPGGYAKGMHVQSRYSADGKFYPAKIIDYNPSTNQFLVAYPDYDNFQEWVLQTSLRKS